VGILGVSHAEIITTRHVRRGKRRNAISSLTGPCTPRKRALEGTPPLNENSRYMWHGSMQWVSRQGKTELINTTDWDILHDV